MCFIITYLSMFKSMHHPSSGIPKNARSSHSSSGISMRWSNPISGSIQLSHEMRVTLGGMNPVGRHAAIDGVLARVLGSIKEPDAMSGAVARIVRDIAPNAEFETLFGFDSVGVICFVELFHISKPNALGVIAKGAWV